MVKGTYYLKNLHINHHSFYLPVIVEFSVDFTCTQLKLERNELHF